MIKTMRMKVEMEVEVEVEVWKTMKRRWSLFEMNHWRMMTRICMKKMKIEKMTTMTIKIEEMKMEMVVKGMKRQH